MTDSILIVDNYDSFVYNLARYLEELGLAVEVVRNDALSLTELLEQPPAAVILSPGPCTPQEAGICLELVQQCHKLLPILGVCLGHQAIAAALGGRVVRAEEPVHGRTTLIEHEGTGLFAGCPNPLQVGRYHSLVVEEASLPAVLRVTSRTNSGIVMSFDHESLPVSGVQFHPESILTQSGHRLLANFLRRAGLIVPGPPVGHETVTTHDLPPDFYQQQIAPDAGRPS